MKQLTVGKRYYIGVTPVIFLGYQDVKHFGFFRLADDIHTFFGSKLSKVKRTAKKNEL